MTRAHARDPDMTADELHAAIDRAEGKRRELEAEQPEAKQLAKVLSILPRAADLYRRQVALGLDGDRRAALKARGVSASGWAERDALSRCRIAGSWRAGIRTKPRCFAAISW